MSVGQVALLVGHAALVLAAVLAAAHAGRWAARRAHQPPVVGELAVGLLLGPALIAAGGERTLAALLPSAVSEWLHAIGHLGLALFLVGVGRSLRHSDEPALGRAVGWIASSALLIPLAAGAVFAGWVLADGDPRLRGHSPAASLALLLLIALSVTAVPVLARILVDGDLMDTRVGRLAMASGVVIDAAAWLLLALALSLAAGSPGRVLVLAARLAAAVLGALVLLRLLRTRTAGRFCSQFPRTTAVVMGAAAWSASIVLQRGGLTEVIGALLLGLAIPAGAGARQWDRAVATVARVGSWLLPVFFVTTGITVFGGQVGALPWAAITMAVLLAVVGKVSGGIAGAALAGETLWTGLRLGVLLNTRGLTELVVLQAGYSAGILTPALYLALVVMALVTTAMTGPAYALVDLAASRRSARRPALDRSAAMIHIPGDRQPSSER
jgi:Kef-type K+ transport system membrane component KefB